MHNKWEFFFFQNSIRETNVRYLIMSWENKKKGFAKILTYLTPI